MRQKPVATRRQVEREFLKAGRPTFSQIVEPGHREEPPEKTTPPLWGPTYGQDHIGVG